jgi:O-antigen/teichoic acid export membrane protein
MAQEKSNALRHSAVYMLARGLPAIVAFLAIPTFSRLLNPTGYGNYALVAASVALLNALIFQWLRLALVRYLPAYKTSPGTLKSTLLTLQYLLIALLGVIAAVVCAIPAAKEMRTVVVCCWVLLAIQAPFEMFCEHARAQIQPLQYMGMQLVRAFLSVGLGAVLIKGGFGWWGPLIGLGIGMLLPVLYSYGRDWRGLRLSIDRKAFLLICQYGLPLSLTVALTVVISTSDRFLIAWILGKDAAGLYSVAVDFTSQTITVIMMVIYLAVFPLAVRAWEERGQQAAQDQMQHNAALLLLVGLPAVVGMSILAPGIADCFLGKSFRVAASRVLPLVAVGTFLAGFKACHFDTAFQFVNRTIIQVWIVLVAAVVNVALNLAVIRRFGINGSAMASVLAYVFAIVLTAVVGRHYMALPVPIRPLLQTLAAAGLMALALYPMRNRVSHLALAAEIVVGMGIYGAGLFALNFLEVRETVRARLSRKKSAGISAPVVEPAAELQAGVL